MSYIIKKLYLHEGLLLLECLLPFVPFFNLPIYINIKFKNYNNIHNYFIK